VLPNCRADVVHPDLEVTVWKTQTVNGTFKYFFYVKNVGLGVAEGVILYRTAGVNYFSGGHEDKNTSYNVSTPIAPGTMIPVEVECPVQVQGYCNFGRLEAKALQGIPDVHYQNDYAFNYTASQ
jgi:hypothetical protein